MIVSFIQPYDAVSPYIMSSDLDRSLKVLSSESHNDEHKACEPIESPLSKTEVIDESVYVCWDDVDD